ncbi:HAMP domain-containing sensor histidine kinase [Fusobacterium russii]|uniref:HAMP domain-containing sensor histidine kinase n=1 Tax=Fusobacterium russii TaxID=854 RepID=UPI0003B51BF1|nr:HAMP domain-containing sensor histidine kinase [Fusobacterium russii]
MLLRKVNEQLKNFFYSIPITFKVTAWYTFFISLLTSIMIVSAFFITDSLIDISSKEDLTEAVFEIAEKPSKFESFDDGIFFIKYSSSSQKIEGLTPKGFDISLPISDSLKVNSYKNDGMEFYYFDSYLNPNNTETEVWIRGILPISSFHKNTKLLLILVLILSPILLFFITYGGYKIIKNSFRPIQEISNTALEIEKYKDFSKRIKLGKAKDEIYKMSFSFNSILDSLEKFYIHEKQFSSDVSHELRTPVTVILAESDYAINYSDSLEEAKGSLSVIQRQAKKMSTLINQIMELSKLEREKNIDLQNIDLSKLINTCLSDYKYVFENKKISLNSSIDENLKILGNKLMLERVFDNLLSNALKFTKSKVSIKLYKADKIILEIEDDGIGLSKEQMGNIWDRFYQVNSSRNKENNQGYGLGLSMVRKIIDLHNACIEVESELEKGAKFRIKFN